MIQHGCDGPPHGQRRGVTERSFHSALALLDELQVLLFQPLVVMNHLHYRQGVGGRSPHGAVIAVNTGLCRGKERWKLNWATCETSTVSLLHPVPPAALLQPGNGMDMKTVKGRQGCTPYVWKSPFQRHTATHMCSDDRLFILLPATL